MTSLKTHFVWTADERVVGASLLDDVTNQVFLAVVRGEHRDLVGRVAEQPHVHEERHHVLRLRQVLTSHTNTMFSYG